MGSKQIHVNHMCQVLCYFLLARGAARRGIDMVRVVARQLQAQGASSNLAD